MRRRTIRLADDVYKLLVNFQQKDESFSQAIVRLFTENKKEKQI